MTDSVRAAVLVGPGRYEVQEFPSYAIEGFTSGDTVVVIGSGPLGLLHVAKADMMGAGQIIATDLSAYRLDWAKRCGADEVINVSTTNPEERIDRIRDSPPVGGPTSCCTWPTPRSPSS